jgi:penicillin-binding protein 1A
MTPKKWWHFLILFAVVGVITLTALTALAVTLIYPTLPSLEALTNYKPKLPLRVYSADGALISEFGEERRAFVSIEKVPKNLKDAVLAIEDRRFYQHSGVDTKGVMRAIKNNITGKSHEGASTITMQVAKNFFTVPGGRRTMITKVKETLLALKIEKALNKDQILELYLNQIYLGQRSYGFAAASQVYFGKSLTKLTLAESALLAGLPKAPTGYNPYINPQRAIKRQQEVLRDMQRYGFIDEAKFKAAMGQTLKFKSSKLSKDLDADYVAEIVRQMLYERYQDGIYSSGLKVYTTIKKANQEAANSAVLLGILEYQRRQGYGKPEKQFNLSELNSTSLEEGMQTALADIEEYGGFMPAIVTSVSPKLVKVFTKKTEQLDITGAGLSLLQINLADKDTKNHKIKVGSVVRLIKSSGQWHIVELPKVESALIALNPEDGAVTALVGGFDYKKNKFNHVTQAWRQPGSSFKPFVYSAALEKGQTPASIFDDSPITMSAAENGSNKSWEPKNFDKKYDGPIRMRTALVKSKNMVSIRLLQKIGPRYAQDYITKFGFSRKDHPAYLTMALGAGNATPWGMATGYAVFANGGYRVTPHIISKITDSNGKLIEQPHYPQAKKDAPRVIDSRNAFIMTSMMKDVVTRGTATKAKVLGRQDLAGKTGTTNNQIDAWFAGYTPKQVAITWIGYDQPRSLGKDETGGKAALPIWIRYMATALRGIPDVPVSVPDGINQLKISSYTGVMVSEDEEGLYEYFYHENPPPEIEAYLPPLEDPTFEDFPQQSIPDNMLDNPLQPQPPEFEPRPEPLPPSESVKIEPRPNHNNPKPAANPSNPAARAMNPSGF